MPRFERIWRCWSCGRKMPDGRWLDCWKCSGWLDEEIERHRLKNLNVEAILSKLDDIVHGD